MKRIYFKKVISIILTLCMLIPYVSNVEVKGMMGDTFTEGGLKYLIFKEPQGENNGTVHVGGNNKEATEIIIPSTVTNNGNTYDVVAIDSGDVDEGFYGYNKLTNITIPDSITSIGSSAFYNCSSLTSIQIPNSVTSIGDGAFYGCSNLSSIELPNSVTSIGNDVFKQCSSLSSIELPNSITSIGNNAFYGCSSLTSITIPDSVTFIDSFAFSNCNNLENVTILSNKLQSINMDAFDPTNKSTNFYVVNENTKNLLINSCEISEDKIKIVNSSLLHKLKLNSNGNGTVTGGGTFEEGTTVTITATANEGYKFDGWSINSGDVTLEDSTLAQTTFIMPANDVEITANFAIEEAKYTLTLNTNSDVKGAVYGSGSYKAGEEITITANPKTGYKFDNWTVNSGDITLADSTLAQTTFTMPGGNVEITANFSEIKVGDTFVDGDLKYGIITLSKDGANGTVNVSGNNKEATSITIPRTVTNNRNTYDVVAIKGTTDDGQIGGFYEYTKLIDIEIPDSITSIGESAFWGCNNLTSIKLPDSITSIGNSAFEGCSSLTNIELPPSITSIDYRTFNGCSSLTNIELPDSITSIGSSAFYACSSLISIELPTSITSIGVYAFKNCSKLESITILSDKLETLDDSAFDSISKNAKFYVVNKDIKDLLINKCSISEDKIEIINSPTSHTLKLNSNGNGTVTGDGTFEEGDTVTITATANDGYEFDGWIVNSGNVSLEDSTLAQTTFVMPTNDVEITANFSKEEAKYTLTLNTNDDVSGAVYGGGSYKAGEEITITANPKTGYKFDSWIVDSGDVTLADSTLAQTTFTMPEGNVEITANFSTIKVGDTFVDGDLKYEIITLSKDGANGTVNVSGNNKEASSITIPRTVTNKGNTYDVVKIKGNMFYEKDGAFYDYNKLISIEIPDSITVIDAYAFSKCSSLTNINLPDSITSIGAGTFTECSSLTNINLPDSITSIGYYTFYGCSNLTNIELPDSITSIGTEAFYKCSSLTSIELPDSITSIGTEAFYKCSSLTSIELPDSITSISKGAFAECSSLTDIKLPNSITSIENNTFSGCSSLINVELPNSITSIGNYAFSGCSSLINVELPNSITSIDDYAFSGCSSLTDIKFPDFITYISSYMFEGCSSLINVELPNSITSIGNYAFSGCSSLINVELPNSITSIDDYAFSGCSSLTSIEINSIISIGLYAFRNCNKLENITILSYFLGLLYDTTFASISENAKFHVVNNDIKNKLINECDISADRIEIIDASKLHTLKLNSNDNGTVSGSGKYMEGKTVTITATANDGYKFDSWTVNSGNVTLEDSTSTQTTFVMPAEDVEITANFVGTNETVETDNKDLIFNIITKPEGETNGTVSVTAANKNLTSVDIPETIKDKDGNTYTVVEIEDNAFKDCVNLQEVKLPSTITVIGQNAFDGCIILQIVIITSDNITIGDDAFTNIADNIIFVTTNDSVKDKLLPFVKDESQIQKPDGDIEAYYSVILKSDSNGTVKGNGIYKQGDTVTITAKANDGYEFDGWTVNSGDITLEDGTLAQTTFIMPANDVEITANFSKEEAKYTLTLNTNDDVWGAVYGGGSYKAGEEITITAKAKEGYKFNNWTVNSGDITLADSTLAQTTFAMPVNDVEITANFIKISETVETPNKDLIFNIITKPEGETNGTVSVTAANKDLTSVDIPETIKDKNGNTYTVVEIEDNAFKDCSNLQHIKLPNTIITIGQGAFENCTNLIEITIPSDVTSIGNNAFKGCIILQIVVIISVDITIGKDAFTNVSDNVIYITTNNDTKDKLKPFVKDENQIQVSDGNVKDTSSVIIRTSAGGTVTGNGLYKSGNTVSLKATAKDGYKFDKWIVISGNITIENINSENTSFTMPDKNVILMANFISNSENPDNNVGDSFVTDDKFIVTVTKPAGSDTQGTVTIVGTTDTSGTITIPSTITDKNGKVYKITFVSDSAFTGNKNIISVIIQNGITSIGNGAFKDCVNLIHISIPDSVTSIGDSAFENCTKLEKIEIPISVILIGNNAFKGCINLSKIIILTIKVIIKNNAFENISKDASFIVINQEIKNILIQIGISESQIVISKGLHKVTVKSDSNGVVAGSGTYSKDDTVTIKATPNEKYKFDKWTVNTGNVILADNKLAETTFTMPDEDVEIIASFVKDEIVIESKDNLDFIVQKPATENEDGEVTFKVIDKNVTSVTIPSKVKDNKGNSYVIKIIPNNAFEGCTNLKEITIPETIISIGDSAFKGCISLIKIILPDTITVIGSNAFEGCTSLIEITIPKNVELIKDNAFLNCTSLIKVIILSLNLQIATNAFTGMSSSTIFIVLNQEVKAILILCHILEIQITILNPESNLQEQIDRANEILMKSYPTLDEVIQSTMDLSDGIIYYFQSK